MASVSQENRTSIFGFPGPNISKYLDPRIIYFNFAGIFGPPEQKFLKCLDLLEIFYPLIILSTHCLTAGGIINPAHLKYSLIPQLVMNHFMLQGRPAPSYLVIFSMLCQCAKPYSRTSYMQYLAC